MSVAFWAGICSTNFVFISHSVHRDRKCSVARCYGTHYLLFDRRAHWGTRMPTPVSWGYTILAAKDSLSTQVREQLRRPKVP